MTSFSTNESLALERSVEAFESVSFRQDLVTAYELNKCVDWVQSHSYKRVCLQFPDEMLSDAVLVASYLSSSTSANIFTLADTSYASCCVDGVAAAHVAADAMIHFGPACLSPHSCLPVLYIFQPSVLDVQKFADDLITVLDTSPECRTLVFYETKFHRHLPALQDAFVNRRDVVICGVVEGSVTSGCSVVCGRAVPEPQSYQQVVFIGSESMLLTNLSLSLPDVSWFIYEGGELKQFPLRISKMLMKRLHLVEKLKDAAVVGILVGTLSVDGCLAAVDRVKSLCKSSGKKCYTVAVGRPNVAKLANFPEIDVFVLVSCPENQLLVDSGDFYQPIVSLLEVELAFGHRQWSAEYSLDFRQLQPGGKLFMPDAASTEVEDSEPDVSLVTGRVRVLGPKPEASPVSGEMDLVARTPGTLVASRAAQFLSERNWGGLEQKLGQTPVETVVQGRRGLPLGYEEEGA